jgi:hypothetical protein
MSDPENRTPDAGSKAISAAVMTLAGAFLFGFVVHTTANAVGAAMLVGGVILMAVGFIVWLGQILRR